VNAEVFSASSAQTSAHSAVSDFGRGQRVKPPSEGLLKTDNLPLRTLEIDN